MTPREALNEVLKDLTQAFGDSLAARIVDSAQSGSQEKELDAASYLNVIKALCKDERIQGMFGELGVKDKQKRWETLI